MNKLKLFILFSLAIVACKPDSSKTAQKAVDQPSVTNSETKGQETQYIKPAASIGDTITVSSLEELVENAKSNTALLLEPGTYSLKENLVYYMTKDERKIIDKDKVETRSIGGQLHFSGLDHLKIIGKKGAIITSENPAAVPFFLLRCSNVEVSNITVKKEIEGTVDLFYVSNSNDIRVEGCTFGGGGTYGVYTNKVNNITINNCKITECTNGAIKVNESRGVNYTNTVITKNKCKVPIVTLYGMGSIVTFNNVSIENNTRDIKNAYEQSDRIFSVGTNIVKVNNSVIRNNPGFDLLGMDQNFLYRTEVDGVGLQ